MTDAFYTEISTLKVRKIACGAKRKEKREKKKNKIREGTIYKINESEPSEYLRQLCLECGKCFFTELQS